MTDAVESRPGPGTNPDRASFTSALQAARDQLIAAQGITDDDAADPGRICSAVLNSLLPARRRRYSARKVKCSTSRYLNRDDGRPFQATTIAHIDITVIAPPPDRPANRDYTARTRPPVTPGALRPNTRREQITKHHDQPAAQGLGRTGTSRPAERPTPQHAHPASRMDTPRLLDQNRHRQVRALRTTVNRLTHADPA